MDIRIRFYIFFLHAAGWKIGIHVLVMIAEQLIPKSSGAYVVHGIDGSPHCLTIDIHNWN